MDELVVRQQDKIKVVEQSIKKSIMKQLKYQFFIFLNGGSGGNKAQSLLAMDVERIKVWVEDWEDKFKKHETEVLIYDLKDRENGLNIMRQEQIKKECLQRIIVGGGDGTVTWIIKEMLEHRIEIDKVPLGIIPLGTGNDLSRCFGWGGTVPSDLVGQHMARLKKRVSRWINAITDDFDVWTIEVNMASGGQIKKIQRDQNGKAIKIIMKDNEVQLRQFSRMFVNYFSCGVDARMGLGFDRNRTKSQFCNKIVYGLEAIKKLFKSTQKISDIVDNMVQIVDTVNTVDIHIEQKDKQTMNMNDPQIIFQTDKTKDKCIQHNFAAITFLNINSYAGGAMGDLWNASQKNKSVIKYDNQPASNQTSNQQQFKLQSFHDNRIEVLGCKNLVDMAKEIMHIRGNFSRIHQGEGPFQLNFKQNVIIGKTKKDVITYIQIDGEFYQLINPQSIVIKKNTDLPRGKIKVLLDKDSRKV